MTLAEFLLRMDARCTLPILVGDPAATWAALRAGRHPDPLMGEVLRTLMDWCALRDLEAPVERAALVNALGPLRLRHMADAGSPAGLRVLDAFVQALDAVFDDAALEQRHVRLDS